MLKIKSKKILIFFDKGNDGFNLDAKQILFLD